MSDDAQDTGPTSFDIPDVHMLALGRAIMMWNDLEFTIDRAIWRLMAKEQAVVACLTAQYGSVFQRLNALTSLIHLFEISDEACKNLKKLQGELSSLSEHRNRIVHDPRFVSGKDNSVGRYEVTARSRLSFQIKKETASELNQFFDEINAV